MRTVGANDAFRWLAALGFLCSPLLTAIAPRWAAIFLPLLVFALLIAAMWHTVPWRELLKPSAALFSCLALSLYVFVNASWAWNPDAGFAKAALLLGLIVVLFSLNAIIATLIQRQRRAFAFAFAIGASLGALYLLVDVLTDGAVTRFAFNALPAIRPDNTKRFVVADGDVQRINLSMLNQSVTIITLSLWPAIMILAGLANRRAREVLIVAFLVVTITAVFASAHDSSQVATARFQAIVFVFAWAWPRFAIRGLACFGVWRSYWSFRPASWRATRTCRPTRPCRIPTRLGSSCGSTRRRRRWSVRGSASAPTPRARWTRHGGVHRTTPARFKIESGR